MCISREEWINYTTSTMRVLRFLIAAILISFSINALSQNAKDRNAEVKDLQWTLMSYRSNEKHYGEKYDKAYELLALDKYNHIAINYLMTSYRETGCWDSIPIFFNKLIENNPNDAEPYLIRENYYYDEKLGHAGRIKNLEKALAVDPENLRIYYLLGKLHYELFIGKDGEDEEKENREDHARNAVRYFVAICQRDEEQKEGFKYPLLQLANYLGDENLKKIYENYNVCNYHLPVSAFMDLPDDWKTNYSVNVIVFLSKSEFGISGLESAVSKVSGYSGVLKAFREQALNPSVPGRTFRFLYLRSFDSPVIIGLENFDNTVTIYWKSFNKEWEMIEHKAKRLTVDDWDKFESKINEVEFWDIPTVEKGIMGLDGSQWVLEGKSYRKYHVVDRWGGGEISSVCRDLIDLAGIELGKVY